MTTVEEDKADGINPFDNVGKVNSTVRIMDGDGVHCDVIKSVRPPRITRRVEIIF